MRAHIVVILTAALGCTGAISVPSSEAPQLPVTTGPQQPDEPPKVEPAQPCTEVTPAPARVIRLSKLELQNTLDTLYGAPGPLEVPRDSKAFGFSTGDQQTVNLPFAEGLQRAAQERGVAFRASLGSTFTGACVASENAARGCAETLLRSKARVAFRREVVDADLVELMEIYALGRDTTASTSVAERARLGLDYAMRALAQSSGLLYRTELGDPGAAAGERVALTQSELASALSYTVLAAPPDEALLTAAAADALSSPEARGAHAARLAAADPTRYATQLERFVTEWLQLDFNKPAWLKSSQTYPSFTPQVLDAVRAETSLTVGAWARSPRLGELLTSTRGFASATTAGLYGLTLSGGAQEVSFDPNQRAGILTSAAFLGTHAHTDGSAPILRGVAVMRGVLCLTLPNPPANIPPLPAVDIRAGATTRETVEHHIASGGAACQGCHALINPMGFAFEAYDGIGRFRTSENGAPVDTSGGIVGSKQSDQAVAGPVQLAAALAKSPEVQRCFARQTFRYTFGRIEGAGDRCTVAGLEQRFIDEGQNTTNLLQALVASELFAYRKVQ